MRTHSKQVAAWGKLSGLCHELGDSFNPREDSLKGTAREILLKESEQSVEAVHIAEGALTHAVNIRDHYIRQLPKIGSRLIGALEAIDASIETLHDVNRLRKRLRYQALPKAVTAQKKRSGGQAMPTETSGRQAMPTETSGRQAEPTPIVETSTAIPGKRQQLDIESKIDNFWLLIETVSGVPGYGTNEADITIEALRTFLKELKAIHQEAIDAFASLESARAQRDKMLYSKQGVYGRSKMVKGYLRSRFGYASEQFKKATSIEFVKI